MMQDRQLRRRLLRYGNAAAALAAAAVMLSLLGAGQGTIPALGPALVPGHGAWTPAGQSSTANSVPAAIATVMPEPRP